MEEKNKQNSGASSLGGAILLAAFALPGVSGSARADTLPEQAEINVTYLDYRDWQPGLDRIAVRSPSVDILTPIAGDWSLQGTLVSDSISGATPHYHTAISGASTMADHRVAQNMNLTRYFPLANVSLGVAHSGENDYQSRAVSFNGSLSTESKNTTVNFGLAVNNDTINPVNQLTHDAKKHTLALLAGVTQIVSQRDIVQFDITHTSVQGYLNDPYKYFDNRPDERTENTLALRWNHYFGNIDGVSRVSYRYYSDTYQIRAHTLGIEYVQPVSNGWTLTPSARIYTQTAASFYVNPVYDPNFGEPVPLGYVFGANSLVSEDQRLASFGALTLGLKLEKKVAPDLEFNVKFESYQQRGNWALFGSGSPGLAPFYARIIEFGLSKRW